MEIDQISRADSIADSEKKRETQREGDQKTHTHKIHKKVSEYFIKGRAIKIYRCRFREKKITGGISLCCESLHFIQENAS